MSAKELCLHVSASQGNYSGTPLIRSPMGQTHLAVLTGWPVRPVRWGFTVADNFQ